MKAMNYRENEWMWMEMIKEDTDFLWCLILSTNQWKEEQQDMQVKKKRRRYRSKGKIKYEGLKKRNNIKRNDTTGIQKYLKDEVKEAKCQVKKKVKGEWKEGLKERLKEFWEHLLLVYPLLCLTRANVFWSKKCNLHFSLWHERELLALNEDDLSSLQSRSQEERRWDKTWRWRRATNYQNDLREK